jgi:hypothetical protein
MKKDFTRREVVQDIVRQGGYCCGLPCYKCPFEDDECATTLSGDPLIEVATTWLRAHK